MGSTVPKERDQVYRKNRDIFSSREAGMRKGTACLLMVALVGMRPGAGPLSTPRAPGASESEFPGRLFNPPAPFLQTPERATLAPYHFLLGQNPGAGGRQASEALVTSLN